jgi:hypothetical protein
LATYDTFSFGLSDQPKPGYEVTSRSLEVQRRLRPVVQAALVARGYVESDTESDFVIKLATGTGPVPVANVQRSAPSPLARGYIGIGIYDRRSGTEVWHGSAFAEIDPIQIDDGLLRMGVEHMFSGLPSKDSGKVAAAR